MAQGHDHGLITADVKQSPAATMEKVRCDRVPTDLAALRTAMPALEGPVVAAPHPYSHPTTSNRVVDGKVLVLGANAVIVLTLALLGLFLGLFLADEASSCHAAPENEEICERSETAGRASLIVSSTLLPIGIGLGIVAIWIHRRNPSR